MNHSPVTTEVLLAYGLHVDPSDALPYGDGHINDTYYIKEICGQDTRQYILQRLNTDIFHKPEELMENVIGITSYLREKIEAAGGDKDRETLHYLPTLNGQYYYIDSQKRFWRLLSFITDITCYSQVTCPDDFYQSALAFGHFQKQLKDYPAGKLHETIPDFHNTPKRYRDFEKAAEEDAAGRASLVAEEIAFIKNRRAFTHILTDQLAGGTLPLRVTHNDTKLNNILFDKTTGKGICIIDLDTVMPGLIAYDFGDSIRFGASTAAEDEADLSKVHFDLSLFDVYAKGFLEGSGDTLTDAERSSLVDGSIMLTLEQAMRFLADYLNGDPYYKTAYPEHNLVRARTQIRLVREMEQMRPQMEAIIQKYSNV